MKKEEYLKIAKDNYIKDTFKLISKQIDVYYSHCNYEGKNSSNYKVGDLVKLKKGTFIHGTYKNIEGLKEIVKKGLIASHFTNGRISKYPSCVGVWNLKQDYKLKDYIDFYSGGTIKYNGLLVNNKYSQNVSTEVISYSNLQHINDYILNNPCRMWTMEMTKEARFLPSLVQDVVQIGIIFEMNEDIKSEFLKGDILDPNNIDDNTVDNFINSNYDIDSFIKNRNNKDDFFTDRESALLFGIPSCLITGILVGRKYEFDKSILKEIKDLLPHCYICNLDGRIIDI